MVDLGVAKGRGLDGVTASNLGERLVLMKAFWSSPLERLSGEAWVLQSVRME